MTAPVSHFVNVEQIPWIQRHPGVLWKVIWEAPEGFPKALLVRIEPGTTSPRHRHLGDEHLFVLEGSLGDDTGVCEAGNYVRRPAGCVHTVFSTTGGLAFSLVTAASEYF